MNPARISWKTPLLAAAAGLVVGVGVRWISHREPTGGAGNAAAAGRISAAHTDRGQPLRVTVTPAARLLHELADADAGHCEQRLREMTAEGAMANPLDLEAVFARWMELAKPREILASVKASGIENQRWTLPFFEAWAVDDYAGAMAGTVSEADFSGARALVAIRRGDPAFLTENFGIWDADLSMTAEALTALGRNDPELAKGVATRRGSKPDQNVDVIAAVVRGWADRDPTAALAWVNSLGLADGNRMQVLQSVLFSWKTSDLPASGSTTKDAGVSADDATQTPPEPASPLAQSLLVNRAEPFASVRDLDRRLSESPINWQMSQVPIPANNSDGWFTTDPSKAATEAAKLPPGKARDFLLSTICAQWADRSPAEATAFAAAHALKPPYVTNHPLASQLGANPAETLAPMFAEKKIDPADREKLRELVATWSKTDPQAAAEWLMGQPESIHFDRDSEPADNMLLGNALGFYWANLDAKGATDWMGTLPDGPRRNTAWRAMNYYVANYSPDLVFTTTAKLVGDDRRMETLAKDLKNLAEKIGLPAAREALETVYLSADESDTLAQSLANPKPAAQ